jgi:hypothetical protein
METNKIIIELEDKISELVFSDNGRKLRFDYKSIDYEVSIDNLESAQPQYRKVNRKQVLAYTYNLQNDETFVLRTSVGDTYESALADILSYVRTHKREMNSYTVVWTKRGLREKQESYFYCNDVIEVVNKFFEGKDKLEYIIYSIKLNPIS